MPSRAARQCAAFSSAVGDDKSQHQFKVLNRDLAYSGWRKVVKKTVQVENEKEYVFDVIHQVRHTPLGTHTVCVGERMASEPSRRRAVVVLL